MQTRPQFRPLMIDYRLYSVADQADHILNIIRDYHERGYTQVGLSFATTREKAQLINTAYLNGNWRTKMEGDKQAMVLRLLEKQLALPENAELRPVFRILPITTAENTSQQGRVKDSWLDDDLVRLSYFLLNKSAVVLGWQNQSTFNQPEAPFTLGRLSKLHLTVKQRAKIQNELLALQRAYPSDYKGEEPSVAFATIKIQLERMAKKAVELKRRGHLQAAVVAEDLVSNLDDALANYWDESRDPNSFAEFQKICEEEIAKARPVLASFRGWGEIFINLSLAIAGAGVFYLAATMLNKAITGRFLFFSKTDSAAKLDSLESSLSLMRP